MSDPRYAIGVDLGTTHSALAWVDIGASDGEATVHGVMDVPQLTAPGSVETLSLLPSFVYLPHDDEMAQGERALPWSADVREIVGELARSRGATTPGRLVSSAKSWLCHPGVDRRADILPVDAPPEVERISPFEASMRVPGASSRRLGPCPPRGAPRRAGRDGHHPGLVRPGCA